MNIHADADTADAAEMRTNERKRQVASSNVFSTTDLHADVCPQCVGRQAGPDTRGINPPPEAEHLDVYCHLTSAVSKHSTYIELFARDYRMRPTISACVRQSVGQQLTVSSTCPIRRAVEDIRPEFIVRWSNALRGCREHNGDFE